MRVVITGAAGRIGSQMVDEFSGLHELRLIDLRPMVGHDSLVTDLTRNNLWNSWTGLKPKWQQSFVSADVILHLAADPRPEASWQELLRSNVEATWKVTETAARLGVARVVFASSNFAVKAIEQEMAPGCYEVGGPKIGSEAPPRPLTAYGVSKALGEMIGRKFVQEKRLASFVAVRIGAYHEDPPLDEKWKRLWIGAVDLRNLLRRCVEAKYTGFHVVYGVSAQSTSPYDLSHTRRLLSWEPRQVQV